MMLGKRQKTFPKLDADLKEGYLSLIEGHFGLRLSDQQAAALDDLIWQLLPSTVYPSPRELYEALFGSRRMDILDVLAPELTIGETHFFRIRPQIQALRQTVLPDLLSRHAADRRLRLWSAGCSTGEEPYTLAILLRELLPHVDQWDIDLHATDISGPALAHARAGLYGEWSFRDTPDEVRERHFVAEAGRWRLAEPVRRMVRFGLLNLAADPTAWPSPIGPELDLIVCRNVTIYFSPEATQRLYRGFADRLRPGGWLVLGPSDPVPEHRGRLASISRPGAVLWRRPDATVGPVPAAAPVAAPAPVAVAPRRPREAAAALRQPGGQATPERPRARRVEAAPGLASVQQIARRGDRKAARELAERLTREQPLAVEAHLLLGMLLLDEGAVELAVESLRRATFLDARHALAHFSLGRAYFLLGDRTRARAVLGHARRVIASLADGAIAPSTGGLRAGQLRRSIDAQLAIFSGAKSG